MVCVEALTIAANATPIHFSIIAESTSSTLSQEEEEREEAMQVLVMKEEQEGEEEGKEGEKEEEREQGERETIQEIHSTRCSKYLSDFLTALKNLVLDLKLFFWYDSILISRNLIADHDCSNSVPLNAILIYNVFSFGAISFYEIFSLWAYTSPHLGEQLNIYVCMTLFPHLHACIQVGWDFLSVRSASA